MDQEEIDVSGQAVNDLFTKIGGDIGAGLDGKPGDFVPSYELFELRTNSALLDILRKGAASFNGQRNQFDQRSPRDVLGTPEDPRIKRVQDQEKLLSLLVGKPGDRNQHPQKESHDVQALDEDEVKRLRQRVDELENENKRLAKELQQALQKASKSATEARNTPDLISELSIKPITGPSPEVIALERDDAGNVKKDRYQALVIRFNDLHMNWRDLESARSKMEAALRSEREKCQRWTSWAENQEKVLSKTKAKAQRQEDENKKLRARIKELEKLHQLHLPENNEAQQETTHATNLLSLTPPILPPPSPTFQNIQSDGKLGNMPRSLPIKLEQQSSNATEDMVDQSNHSNQQLTTLLLLQETLVAQESDDPVVISTRPVRKRKARADTAEPARPKVKVENINSSPIGLALFREFSSCGNVDLDEIGDKVDTPRKRYRTRGSSNLQRGEEAHSDEFILEGRSPLQPLSSNTSQNTPSRASKSAKAEPAVHIVSSNRKVLPRTSDKPAEERGHREARATAIENVFEGGEMLPSASKKIATKQSDLLHDLLERPSPRSLRMQTLSPTKGVVSTDGLSHVTKASSFSAIETPLSKQPVRLGAIKSAKSSIKKRQGKSTPDQLNDKPLRSRPLEQLGLEHFKVNPDYNHGYDFAFSDVVRKQSDRRCLRGCTKPECCGTKFRKLAEMALESPEARTLSQEQHNQNLLEDFLGSNKHRLDSMTTAEKDELLVQAKTRELANKLGRHRHTFERRKTPPGFWDTDMPSTQEEITIRELAKKAERELVEQRYMEAMRQGGAYIFRDE
ncbi:DNA repair protein endonuclease SAE2/CtIP C-terminus-domain-containing protein [Xylogone sp. PMI_703]|nr:DNA repair protein endonuclease SAE2/CtIP C-terminus-domain-containing protein [Xylogone sp. PMI_703]